MKTQSFVQEFSELRGNISISFKMNVSTIIWDLLTYIIRCC